MAERGKTPQPKTQREISISQHTAYDESRGNPNDITPDIENRGNQTSMRGDNVEAFTLGLKDIDEAIMYYLDEIIKPTVMQNGVAQKVPIIYGSPERWKQIQKDGYYRDKKGKIMMPIISFKRNNIVKDRTVANKLDANNPNNVSVYQKPYSQKNAYDKFNVLNNQKPQKDLYVVIVPDYVTISYDFLISTYYVEQMNKLIEAVNYASDSYWGDKERFKFRARIDSYDTPIELNQGGERVVKTTFSLKLYGYLVPDTVQKQLNTVTKFHNKTKLKFNFEIVDRLNLGAETTKEEMPYGSYTENGYNISDDEPSTGLGSLFPHIHVDKEIPTGAMNGVNKIFTLSNIPIDCSELIFLNGLFIDNKVAGDYTISENTLTLLNAPSSGSIMIAHYRYENT
jgi:hypothetical protein